MKTENKKREVPKQLQNELYDKVEPYIERIIAAYEKEGLGFSRFSLKSIGMQCAAIGYYHESDKDQLQDTTLVPIEEDFSDLLMTAVTSYRLELRTLVLGGRLDQEVVDDLNGIMEKCERYLKAQNIPI